MRRTPLPTDAHFVVCGDDPLALRVCDELVTRYQARIAVVMPAKQANYGPRIAALPGVRIVEAPRLDAETLHAAGIRTATAIAMVRQDDVGNIQAALLAQELQPGIRVVIRMFNIGLGQTIRPLLGDCAVLSDAEMAAPAFVAAALGQVTRTSVRLPGRTLFAARRDDVAPGDVVCGLADTSGTEPILLPADQSRADLVLAAATGNAAAAGTAGIPDAVGGTRRMRRRPVASALGLLRSLVSRKLRIAALALVGLLVVGTGLLAALDDGLNVWQAAYVTILNAVGGANADLTLSAPEKLVQTATTLVGLAMIPVITAAVVDAAVNARLALALGRLRGPVAGHVVVVGLGNVGTRIIRYLHEAGVQVVAIDRAPTALGAAVARELGIPLIVGDAGRDATLRAASVRTARALVVVTTDDVANLEAALTARQARDDLRVVLRLFDGDFAHRVERTFGITSSRSVSYLAAPVFAAAMLERDVIGTVPVGRRLLLIAQVLVAAGSVLDGAPLSVAYDIAELRVIALVSADGGSAVWAPPPDRRLAPGERLVVVATRAGLGALVGRTITAAAWWAERAADSTT